MDYTRKALIGKWAGHSDLYTPFISVRLRWFYRIKAAVCLLLNREPSKQVEIVEHIHVTNTGGGCYFDGEFTVHWYEAIIVGYGIFGNWWATIYGDSD